MNKYKSMFCATCLAFGVSMPMTASAQEWLTMPFQQFAEEYADQAFSDSPEARYQIAWMLFARLNQQVEADGKKVSIWETWPSDPDTFSADSEFVLGKKKRAEPSFVTSKRDLFKKIDTSGVSVGGEEVVRNMLGYGYIRDPNNKLYTAEGVTAFLKSGKAVQMPIGSVEIKARWEQAGTPITDGAYTFEGGDKFALTGMHIMFKMRETPADVYQDPAPSWFWTTFEFDKNPGLAHVRRALIDQPHGSDTDARAETLAAAGLSGSPFEMYSPNGTQKTFEEDGAFRVLGHTMMEAFAGLPDTHPPTPPGEWTGWNSSCHSCHATASWKIVGNSGHGNNMPEPVGPLSPEILKSLDGFQPLDFMWPIAFNATGQKQ